MSLYDKFRSWVLNDSDDVEKSAELPVRIYAWLVKSSSIGKIFPEDRAVYDLAAAYGKAGETWHVPLGETFDAISVEPDGTGFKVKFAGTTTGSDEGFFLGAMETLHTKKLGMVIKYVDRFGNAFFMGVDGLGFAKNETCGFEVAINEGDADDCFVGHCTLKAKRIIPFRAIRCADHD